MFRQLKHKIVSLFLAVGIIFSTVGVTVSVHTCIYSGKKKASFFSIAGCCLNPDAEKTQSCCLTDTEYSQLDTEKVLTEGISLPQALPLLFAGYVPDYSDLYRTIEREKRPFDTRPPPLLSGTDRIHAFQQFLL